MGLMDKVVYALVSDCDTLAYSKGKNLGKNKKRSTKILCFSICIYRVSFQVEISETSTISTGSELTKSQQSRQSLTKTSRYEKVRLY